MCSAKILTFGKFDDFPICTRFTVNSRPQKIIVWAIGRLKRAKNSTGSFNSLSLVFCPTSASIRECFWRD